MPAENENEARMPTSSMDRTRLRYQILQVERDAEKFRAEQLSKILWSLAGGIIEDADCAPASTLVPSATSTACSAGTQQHPPSSNPTRDADTSDVSEDSQEGTRADSVLQPQVQSDGAVSPISRGRPGPRHRRNAVTRAPKPSIRRRHSTSERELARRRARLAPTGVSFIDARASRVTNRRKKRKRNANVQRIGRATSTTPSAHSDNTSGFHDPTAIQSLLRRAGLEPLELASCETARAEETPGINWPTFWRTFGGQPKSRDEWLYCCKIPSHKWFFRGNASAQPYGPTSPGQPGLLLIAPATIDAPRGDQDSSLHLFMSQRTGRESTARLHYRGEYTRTRLPELQPIWHDLPLRCRQTWVRRFTVSWDPAIRALRARIRLRNELEREPSVGEIQAYVEGTNEGYDVSYKDISAAFQEGKEVLAIRGVTGR